MIVQNRRKFEKEFSAFGGTQNESMRKKDWSSLNVSPPAPPVLAGDSLQTAKRQAVREAVSNLKPMTTFAAIGEQIGYSRQYVSKKMQERFKGDPAAMWLIGNDWRVPRKTAELWLSEFFDA